MCSFSTTHLDAQEIIESSTIANVLPLIDEETWVLVDLDNTVFQAKQALDHVNWLQHEVQKQIDSGKSREDAFYSIYPLYKDYVLVLLFVKYVSDKYAGQKDA